MSRDACTFVFIKQGIAYPLQFFLCFLPCGIDFCLLVFSLRLDLLCDVKPFSLLMSSATLAALLLTKVVSYTSPYRLMRLAMMWICLLSVSLCVPLQLAEVLVSAAAVGCTYIERVAALLYGLDNFL